MLDLNLQLKDRFGSVYQDVFPGPDGIPKRRPVTLLDMLGIALVDTPPTPDQVSVLYALWNRIVTGSADLKAEDITLIKRRVEALGSTSPGFLIGQVLALIDTAFATPTQTE